MPIEDQVNVSARSFLWLSSLILLALLSQAFQEEVIRIIEQLATTMTEKNQQAALLALVKRQNEELHNQVEALERRNSHLTNRLEAATKLGFVG